MRKSQVSKKKPSLNHIRRATTAFAVLSLVKSRRAFERPTDKIRGLAALVVFTYEPVCVCVFFSVLLCSDNKLALQRAVVFDDGTAGLIAFWQKTQLAARGGSLLTGVFRPRAEWLSVAGTCGPLSDRKRNFLHHTRPIDK